MATMDLVKLHGGEPGQLPRRRRRGHRGAGGRGLQADPVRPQGAGRPGQHLRRHRALRPDRRGHHAGGARGRRRRPGGGAPGGHQRRRRAWRMLAAQRSGGDHRRSLAEAADKVVAAAGHGLLNCQGSACMSVLVDQEHPGHLPGLHRQAGHLPQRTGDCLRHQPGGRRDPRQGRSDAPGPAGLRHRARRRGRRPAPTPP